MEQPQMGKICKSSGRGIRR